MVSAVAALARIDHAVAVLGAERAPHRRRGSLGLLFGVERDVQAQQELLEVRGVLDVDVQVANRVHHPVLAVLHLEAEE